MEWISLNNGGKMNGKIICVNAAIHKVLLENNTIILKYVLIDHGIYVILKLRMEKYFMIILKNMIFGGIVTLT